MKHQDKILVVGAGLCGSMLALRLAQKGYDVVLREKRPDMRKKEMDAGRSINLALSDRGLRALKMVGLEEEARKLCTPMEGRMIHFKNGEKRFSRYSGRQRDYINSISRPGLNTLLLNAAEATGKVEVYFESTCTGADLEKGVTFFNTKRANGRVEEKALIAIGTDGAGSAIRNSYMKNTTRLLFNYSQDFLRTGYKEVSIPPSKNGGYRIEDNALHIWPRESFMIIALPNLDGSFTVTLFWPFHGENGFDQISDTKQLHNFFKEEFADLLPHLKDLDKEYFENPTGALGTVKCWPWHANGKFLLLGDAAHAIVPFYGQGMNASFEDVLVLDEVHDACNGNWDEILPKFAAGRKPDADAIADLAVDNFYEMQDHVADPDFIRKRDLEMQLEQTFEDYYSKYSLVTFREDLSYNQAMRQGRLQDAFLLDLCRRHPSGSFDIHEVHENLKKHLSEVL
jgi:kynurenine 3-monooxygenase